MEQAQTRTHGAAALARTDLGRLIQRAQHGDGRAMDALVRNFTARATTVASDFFLIGADRDDLIQEARIGIYKAVRDYNPAKPTAFTTFLDIVVRRQVITAVKTMTRKKHQALTFSVRTAKSDESEAATVFDAVDVIEAPNADAHELLADHDRAMLILRVIRDEMSELERTCIVGYANGESYVDTALRLGLEVRARGDQPTKSRSKTIDNALQRARLKIRLALVVEDERLPLGAAA